MISMQELVEGISKENPAFKVKQVGKKPRIRICKEDEKLGRLCVDTHFSRTILNKLNADVCCKIAHLVEAAFARKVSN